MSVRALIPVAPWLDLRGLELVCLGAVVRGDEGVEAGARGHPGPPRSSGQQPRGQRHIGESNDPRPAQVGAQPERLRTAGGREDEREPDRCRYETGGVGDPLGEGCDGG